MCLGMPSPPPPPPAPPPPPSLPDQGVQLAGAQARQRAMSAAGPMSTIINVGGAPGLTTPPATTAKSQTGA